MVQLYMKRMHSFESDGE